jgi:hypothetical protein
LISAFQTFVFLKPSKLSFNKKFSLHSQLNQKLYIKLFFPSHVRSHGPIHYCSFNASYKANKRRGKEEKNIGKHKKIKDKRKNQKNGNFSRKEEAKKGGGK